MRELLEEARADARVVTIDRERFEEEDELGYVVAVGETLFMMLLIVDGSRFNGFSVLPIEDVSHIELPHPHAEFVESALRLRGEEVESAPEIDLSSMASAVRTAGRLAPLVTVHTEATDQGICQIGSIRGVDETNVRLITIDPDADWDDEIATIPLADVTRLDFGGGYEEALLLVGGPCPVPLLRSVE